MTEERVKYLLARYGENTLTQQEQEELDFWYAQHDNKEDDPFLQNFHKEKKQTGNRIFKRIEKEIDEYPNRILWVRWAAVISVLMIASFSVYVNRETVIQVVTDATMETIVNPRDYLRQVKFPDHSEAWLRPGSSVRYNAFFWKYQRHVEMEGEAFFEVRKNPDNPFVVHSGLIKTTVLGTTFSVKAIDHLHMYEVVVNSGKVNVQDTSGHSTNVIPAERVRFMAGASPVVDQVNVEEYLGWRSGRLKFYNTSFREIKWYLEKVYDVRLLIENERLENSLFSGDFTGLSLKNTLEIMQEIQPFKITVKADKVIVIS